MAVLTYDELKKMVNTKNHSCAVMSVRKNPDGSFGELRYCAVNEAFLDSNYALFADTLSEKTERKDFKMDGELYTAFLPREPKFEDISLRCAFNGEHFHQYVDTTKMYGLWTENLLLPLAIDDDDPDIGYYELHYLLNKEMDAGKFSVVPPDLSSFVIKACLEMKQEQDFTAAMDVITKDIFEFTDSHSVAIIAVSPDLFSFEVVSNKVKNDEKDLKETFSHIPYEVIDTWEGLCGETDCVIIKDENDLNHYAKKAPQWVDTLIENDVHSLCLVPLIYQNAIIGYIFMTNFDISKINRVKEALQLMDLFIASEMATHMVMDRMEHASTLDFLSGVFNRNTMNVNVDELSTKLKLNPAPFSIVFCCLPHLKQINEANGHDEGDQLIKDAAELLKLIFHGDKVFRSCGDEFTVISTKCSKEEFEEKIEALKEEASDPDWLQFAIGYFHDPVGENLRLGLRKANEAMHAEKEKL